MRAPRLMTAIRVATTAVGVGLAGELLFDGHAPGINVLLATIALLVVVNIVGPQATITDQNLQRALVPGAVPEFGQSDLDAPYLGGLGADAIPQLVGALAGLPEPQQSELRASLRAAHQRLVLGDGDGWQASNLARIRARAALEMLFGRAP